MPDTAVLALDWSFDLDRLPPDAADAEFVESEHPRDNSGKFGSGGNGKTAKPKLTPTEKTWVSMYSGDHFLKQNAALRNGDDSGSMVKNIDSAISKSPLPSGTKLYRQMDREAAKKFLGGSQINAGDVISDKAFMSTSTEPGRWGMGGVVFEIEAAEGQTGLNMHGLGENASEKEVLLPRNTKMVIHSIVAPKEAGQPVRVKVKTLPNEKETAHDAALLIVHDRLTFDQSFRYKDQDGRLHIKWTNISKATVNPYRGREIPGWEALGLDPERIYQLWRHPEELAKGAATFNGIQVMSSHLAVDASGAMKEQVAGALGNDAEFRPPYLGNSMTVWWKEDIDDIESKEKCQLSCGYYYDPDMTPGEIQGLRFDGVMRNIRANHVALVQAGRAGPDVLVHDSKDGYMNTAPLASRKAVMVKGALTAFLMPRVMPGTILALDAAIGAVNRANWRAEKPRVLAAVSALATPVLAKDAKMDGLKEALDWMDDEDDEAEDEMDPDAEDEGEESEADREKRMADEKKAHDKKARDAKTAKDKKTARDARRARDAESDDKSDTDPGTADDEETEAEMEARMARDKKANDMKTAKDKKAMDAAIETATAGVVSRMNALIKAREAVRPLVGNVSLALDSAEAVYKFALEAKKFPLNGIPPAAYEGLVAVLPRDSRPQPNIAVDAAMADDVFTRFPGMARIRLS